MKKNLVATSCAIGLVFDVLAWDKIPGISFPLFVWVSLAAGYLLIKKEGFTPAKNSFLVLGAIILFSLMSVIRREPFTTFLNFALSLFGMALLAISYLNGLWVSFNITDYISQFFRFAGGALSLPFLQRESVDGIRPRKALAPILRGLALSLPVWVVFAALLYSADLIFAQRLDTILGSVNLENMMEIVVRLIMILMVGYIFSGAVLFAAQRSGNGERMKPKSDLIPSFLGLTEAAIIFGGVALLFGAFVLVQSRYFFSGQANIHIEGFTYAEYARRGFGELLGVAVLSVLLIKSLSAFSKRQSPAQRRTFAALSALMVALTLVILASAFKRLSLYETAYGFSRLRTYAHVFMIYLGIFLTSVALMEIFQRQNRFINVGLATACCFTLTLVVLNVDQFIVRKNIQRAVSGEALDAGYLSSLSSDAIPALAHSISSSDTPDEMRQGLGAALVCFQQDFRNQSLSERPWPSFHFADQAALNALDRLKEDLAGYQFDDSSWPAVVTGPNGGEYPCQGYPYFD